MPQDLFISICFNFKNVDGLLLTFQRGRENGRRDQWLEQCTGHWMALGQSSSLDKDADRGQTGMDGQYMGSRETEPT